MEHVCVEGEEMGSYYSGALAHTAGAKTPKPARKSQAMKIVAAQATAQDESPF